MRRADRAPFVGYMQRHTHQPKNKHLKFINRVLRYCKRVKTGMCFKRLVALVRAVVVADAAYRSNEDRSGCLALRGSLIAVVGMQPSRSLHSGGHC
eukprot:4406670-Prorocentrum_lima.AAC.1